MLGWAWRMSSRNSVRRRAALLYFYLDWLNWAWRLWCSWSRASYSYCLTTIFLSCYSNFCSKKLMRSSLPPPVPPYLAISSSILVSWDFYIRWLRGVKPTYCPPWLLLFIPDIWVASCSSCFRRLMTFWQKWERLASSFSTSLWISISRWYVSIYCFILLFLKIRISVCFDWCSSSVVS